MLNEFGSLDAQSPVCSFAQFTPEEHAEYQAYLDALHQECVANDSNDVGASPTSKMVSLQSH